MRQLVSMGALAFAPARPAVWVEYHSKRFVGAQERWSVGWYPERSGHRCAERILSTCGSLKETAPTFVGQYQSEQLPTKTK
jgi:hypothetical protein